MELIAIGIILFHIILFFLFFWFIDTLGKIKVYLRDIRDIAQRSDRNR